MPKANLQPQGRNMSIASLFTRKAVPGWDGTGISIHVESSLLHSYSKNSVSKVAVSNSSPLSLSKPKCLEYSAKK